MLKLSGSSWSIAIVPYEYDQNDVLAPKGLHAISILCLVDLTAVSLVSPWFLTLPYTSGAGL